MSTLTHDIDFIINRLNQGDIAAIPTETVYGLAAHALHEPAIKKIFSMKKRPAHHPLIMHIDATWDLTTWVSFIPDYAYALIESYWPGPLTLVFQLKPGKVSPLITGGHNTIAIRSPDHPVAQHILSHLGQPFVAPSANPYGKISPTTAEHVQDSFPEEDVFILQGGRCKIGLESTIVSALDPKKYHILRYGAVSESHMTSVLSYKSTPEDNTISVPGTPLHHYQPEKKLFYFDEFIKDWPRNSYILSFSNQSNVSTDFNYQFPTSSQEAAYEFYFRLRVADQSPAEVLFIELPPETNEWMAIREKILKAGIPLILKEE